MNRKPKKTLMKPLTADEYRAVLRRLRLTHPEAGVALGLGDRTSRRYAQGGTIPDRTVRMLYMLLQERRRTD